MLNLYWRHLWNLVLQLKEVPGYKTFQNCHHRRSSVLARGCKCIARSRTLINKHGFVYPLIRWKQKPPSDLRPAGPQSSSTPRVSTWCPVEVSVKNFTKIWNRNKWTPCLRFISVQNRLTPQSGLWSSYSGFLQDSCIQYTINETFCPRLTFRRNMSHIISGLEPGMKSYRLVLR